MNTKATVFAILTGFATAMGVPAEETNTFKSDKEKIGYAVGMNLGMNWKRQEIDLDFDQLLRGLKDSTGGGKTLLSESEVRDVLNKFQQELMAKQQEKRRVEGEKNKKQGEEFLAQNKTKPGVITLTNGLQYKVITDGTGEIPKPEDTVSVNYRGTLIDGTEFDSSAKAGKPWTTRVTGVIRGWTEALTRMKVGSKWQLFIPSDLAYGERGGQGISPNATLIFDVELVSIQPPAPPVQSTPLTSDIIKVPSLEEMKKGAKIETIKAEDVEKLVKEQQAQQQKQPKQPEKK